MDFFEQTKVEINILSISDTTNNPKIEEENEPSNCKCTCACCANNHGPNLPLPGWRFVPKDDELIVDYLMRKLSNKHVPGSFMHDVEFYKANPQELSGKYPPVDEEADIKEWYFFTPRYRKYPNGKRPKRSTGLGYWKATGVDKKIRREGVVVGSKKALKFYVGQAQKGVKTNWIMQEFKTNDPEEKKENPETMKLDSYVLCKIYQNNRLTARNQHDNAENSEEGNVGSDEGNTEEDNSEENETNAISDQQTDGNENEANEVAFDEKPNRDDTNNGIGANQQLENPRTQNPLPNYKYVHHFQSQIQQLPKMMRSPQVVTRIAPAVQGQLSNFPQVNNGFIRNPFFSLQQQAMSNIEFPVLPDVNNGLQSYQVVHETDLRPKPVVTQPIFQQENSVLKSCWFVSEKPPFHGQVFNGKPENNRWRTNQFVQEEPLLHELVTNVEQEDECVGYYYRSCEDPVTPFNTNCYYQDCDQMISRGAELETNVDGDYFPYDLSAHKRRRFEK